MKIYKITIELAISVCILLLAAGAAHAKIYKWLDDEGKLNFVNDESLIPGRYRDVVEVLDYGGGSEDESGKLRYVNELAPITLSKGERAFEGTKFGSGLDEFFAAKDDVKLVSEGIDEKVYAVGDGMRRLGDNRVKVGYYFVAGLFDEVKVSYDGKVEQKIVRELKKSFGDPDFEKYPFIYWFYGDLELKVRKDEDFFSIFKKKIKKF